jgi:hypothetical protein
LIRRGGVPSEAAGFIVPEKNGFENTKKWFMVIPDFSEEILVRRTRTSPFDPWFSLFGVHDRGSLPVLRI